MPSVIIRLLLHTADMVLSGSRGLSLVSVAACGLMLAGRAFARDNTYMALRDSLVKVAMYVDVPSAKFFYDWKDAVLLKSLIDVYDTQPSSRQEISAYAVEVMNRVAAIANGKHPNAMASGVGFAFLNRTGAATAATDSAAAVIYRDYKSAIRSAEGGVSHRATHLELWDDTLYMTGIYLIGMYRSSGDFKYLSDLADEFVSHALRLRDGKSGLWYHGWSVDRTWRKDWCCQQGWNDNPDQRNHEFWGRGNGWVAMALADILEYLPESDPRYLPIKEYFTSMLKTLICCRDGKSRHWFQLPLRAGEEGNFLESSCTAMFAYAMAKGARLGIVPAKYRRVAAQSYKALVDLSVENRGTSELTLGRICAGTCIGDPQYYYARKIVSGETYALGALIMLGTELYCR